MKYILIFILILSTSCSSKPDNFPNVESIIVEQEIPDIKLTLTVNIFSRINREQLKTLAEKIYDEYNGEKYENVFILYLLPNMEVGNGGYASSHYDPNLELRIYELTDEQIQKIKSKFTISNRYWIDRKVLFEIINDKGKYFLKQYGDDLSNNKQILLKSTDGNDTIYKKPNNEFGEYYLLDNNDDLSIYDEQGYINRFLKE